jgi:hypothetical protein
MQGYQSHTTSSGSHHSSALSLCSTDRLVYSSIPVSTVGRDRPAVPVSPGHVRRLRPYPPSRRRRQ